MAKYRKKPVVVEAFRWTAGIDQTEDPEWIIAALQKNKVRIIVHAPKEDEPYMEIDTLEETHKAYVGDYIIKGVKGELYPCKSDIFEQTYELVEEDENEFS